MSNKKIGFIDYCIDEFHSHKYVQLFQESRFKDRMEVSFAYEEKCMGGMNIDEWCNKYNITRLNSPKEVVNKSDYIIVLSPDNPERHYDLSNYALRSGKPTYVDKTFALDVKTAMELITLAEASDTPMFSTSALRYSKELDNFIKNVKRELPVSFVSTRGPNKWDKYAIHQVEMVVMLLGKGMKRAMQVGKGKNVVIVLDYNDERSAIINCIEGGVKINGKTYSQNFELNIIFGQGATSFAITDLNTLFSGLVDSIGELFETRIVPVSHEETLEVIKIIEAGEKAIQKPFTWIEI